MINFRVPADFKLAVDLAVTNERTTLRELCTRVLAQYLNINLPDSDRKDEPEK